jgi:hypothetical protein
MPGKIRFGVYELDRDAMELRKRGFPAARRRKGPALQPARFETELTSAA